MADKHKGEELKGRAKEAVGDLTNNDDLKREGKIDQSSARTKDKIGKAADSVKDVTKPRR
jgi:uncharacterized protein YjbJ (UPF0337 family)